MRRASDAAHVLLDQYVTAREKLEEFRQLQQARQGLVYEAKEQVQRQELEVSALWRRLQDVSQ